LLPKALTDEESSDLQKKIGIDLPKEKSSYGYLETLHTTVVIEMLFSIGARVSEIANLRRSTYTCNRVR